MISSCLTQEPQNSYSRWHRSFYNQLVFHQVPSDLADSVAWKLVYEDGRVMSREDQAMIDAALALVRNLPIYREFLANRGSGRISV